MELIQTDNRNSRSIFKNTTEDGVDELYIVVAPIVKTFDKSLTDSLTVARENSRFTTYGGPFKITKISPATKSDMYAARRTLKFAYETYDYYLKNVHPYVVNQPCEWIENIFDGSAEADTVLFKNDEMLILPDIDWTDQSDLKQLNCLLLVSDNKLMSIRDLNATHIPLLKNMIVNATKTIKDKYDIDESHLKLYFHYHPSYWWLHIHVTHIDMNYGSEERNHSLHNVIENLTIDSAYYQKVNLRIHERKWTFLKKSESTIDMV